MQKAQTSLLTLWKWPLIVGLLSVLCVVLLLALFAGGQSLSERAYQNGRRLGLLMEGGVVLGNAETSPVQKARLAEEAKPAELPPVVMAEPPPVREEFGPAQAQMNAALPAHFEGEKLEAQKPSALDAAKLPMAEKPAYEYPMAVKSDPTTRVQSVAAPANKVRVRDLLEVAPTGNPLLAASLPALVQKTNSGEIPKISKDGKRPWQAYAKPFAASAQEPLVAIIITGLGMSVESTQAAQHLQENFTLSFSPYAKEAAMWAGHARADGHEVLIDLPMQLADYPASDPGPHGLLASLAPSDNKERLHWVLGRFSGFVGLMQQVGAAIPASVIQNCLTDIAARGLLMVQAPKSAEAPAVEQQKQMGLLNLKPDVLVDSSLGEQAIRANLALLVENAKKNCSAIGVARAYPLTLAALQNWQKELAGQGVRLAPISALAARLKQ